MRELYTATVTVTGGREGQVKSSDHAIDLKLAMPKELGGKGGQGTNPEQLFAAGYASCFDSALQLIIDRNRIENVTSTRVTAHVSLFQNEADDAYKLGVKLQVNLEGAEAEQASKLVQAAHDICPYSNAIKGNIVVETTQS